MVASPNFRSIVANRARPLSTVSLVHQAYAADQSNGPWTNARSRVGRTAYLDLASFRGGLTEAFDFAFEDPA